MSHKKTGFPLGRPRKGEIRPPTPGGIYQAALRAKRKAEDPEYYVIQADYQRLWVLANHEARKKQSRAYYARKKLWDKANRDGGITVELKVKM